MRSLFVLMSRFFLIGLLLWFKPCTEVGFASGLGEEFLLSRAMRVSPLHSLCNSVEGEGDGERRYRENNVSLLV